jgi:predicted chitinase
MKKGLNYILECRGAPYVWWLNEDEILDEGPPSWSKDQPPPDASVVRAQGGFCASVPNLMLRAEGQEIPGYQAGDEPWDGGIVAYCWYYIDYLQVAIPFDLNQLEEGDLLLRRYRDVSDQGHVAVYLADGHVMQSYDGGGGWPGFNSNATAEASHAGYFYEWIVKAKDWIGADSDVDRAESTHIRSGSALTPDHLVSIAGCSQEVAEKVLPRAVAAMQEFGITSRLQVAAFLANCAQETDWFNTYEEYGDYNYWLYLDQNSGVSGEWRYHGRGAIMLTWSDNYRAAGDYFGQDFVGNPDLVKEPNTAWRVAGWYWRHGSAQGDINPIAAAGNFSNVVLAINGGWNGWDVRVAAYNAALEALPQDLAILASEAGDGAVPDWKWFGITKEGWGQFDGPDCSRGWFDPDWTFHRESWVDPSSVTPVVGGNGAVQDWKWLGITKEGWGQFDGPDCSRGWFDPDWTFHRESWVDPNQNGGSQRAYTSSRDGKGEQGRQGAQPQGAQPQGAPHQGPRRYGRRDRRG